ncbi:uncharacterized protein LOC142775743 isoform X3 [Rhipicephalus microplus]|uniref:uncharacterized protein LOC142775743 isoform X3 n=1 Tax=Rhipicephalus microplus TaxID=6941 RepID=UPI003F6A6927
MLEIVVDRSLFSDLDVIRDNGMLYGALFRAYMWHHATFRPLGVGSSIQMDKWMNSLTVTGVDLQYEWLPVWKGRFTDGNTLTACHFELQCFLPDSYNPSLKEFLPHYEKPVRESCVILRLSYWDDVDMKSKPSTSSSTDWQHNLLMEKPCQSASVGDQCHQEPSGHLHFVLMPADNMNLVYPFRKTPPFTET